MIRRGSDGRAGPFLELSIFRGAVTMLAAAGPFAAALLAPAAARASGCTDEWKSTASGSWTTASDWSTGKVPGSGDEATNVNLSDPKTFTNEGALDLGEGDHLLLASDSAFVNGTDGSIAATRSGAVLTQSRVRARPAARSL